MPDPLRLTTLRARVRALFRRNAVADEIREELEFHLQMRADEYERAGESPAEAARHARQRVGNLTVLQDRGYDVRGAGFMDTVIQNIRYALRVLRKAPGFTTIAVFTLALGIGANTAIFSLADAALLRRLPYPDADRIVLIWETEGKFRTAPVTGPDYLEWKRRQSAFDVMGAGTEAHVTLTGAGIARRVDGLGVTPEPLRILGARLALGRLFVDGDMGEGHDHVVILSHALWQESFGSDPNIVGKTLHFDGVPFTVIGVLSASFRSPSFWIRDPQFWVPVKFYGEDWRRSPGSHWLWVLGKMKPGVSLAQARASMQAIAAALRQEQPTTHAELDANVMPVRTYLVTDVHDALAMLLVGVAFILAIACANLANLLMAQAVRRRGEIAVRKALGARSGRIFGQLLTESLVLSLFGTLVGLAIGVELKRVLISMAPAGYVPTFNPPAFDFRVFAFAALLAIVTAAVFGAFPIIEARRSNATEVLSAAGRSIIRSGRRLRQSLVVIEVASAMVLLFAAGVGVHSLYLLMTQDLGFEAGQLMTASVSLPAKRYGDPERAAEFFRQLLDRMRAVPGVADAAVTSELPLQGYRNGVVWIEGQPAPTGFGGPLVSSTFVSPGYLHVMGIPVLRGRGFTDADAHSSSAFAIVNETMAHRFWPASDVIGKRFSFDWLSGKPQNWIEVVGVVTDIRQYGLRAAPYPGVYVLLPSNEALSDMSVVIRTKGNEEAIAAPLAAAVHDIDPDVPLSHVQVMTQAVSDSAAPTRFGSGLLALLASLAFALAGAGIFGVMWYLVVQRTHEFGIRLALGASRFQLLRDVLIEAIGMTAIGIIIGSAGVLFAARGIRAIAFDVGPYDPITFSAAIAALAVCSVLAAYWPARWAARVDPMIALRLE